MRLAGITQESTVDGPGLRFVLFAQGCVHKCPYCHNPESWINDGGKEFSVKEIIRLLKKQRKIKRGITFSGGEPFLQAAEFFEVAVAARNLGLDVVTYTGFTYEKLIEEKDDSRLALISASNILIDGKYIHDLRDIELQFCGSSNQRVIDVEATQKCGEIVLWSVGKAAFSA